MMNYLVRSKRQIHTPADGAQFRAQRPHHPHRGGLLLVRVVTRRRLPIRQLFGMTPSSFPRSGASNKLRALQGYSKAGLLHHYPTKTALYEVTIDDCQAQISGIRDRVATLPVGRDRDERTVGLLVDLSLARPGLASLLLSTVLPTGGEDAPELDRLSGILFSAFGGDADNESRRLRVIAALVTLGVLSLEAQQSNRASEWRNEIITTSADSLGEHR